MAADYPTAAGYRQDLAASRHGFGLLLAATGRRTEAEQALREAYGVRSELAAKFPGVATTNDGERTFMRRVRIDAEE